MSEEHVERELGWLEYFKDEDFADVEIKIPENESRKEGISLIVESPEYLRKKEQERLEEERRKEEERREIERQKELERLEEERKKQEEKERQERDLLERQREEEHKIEEMRKRVNESLLDNDNWREIPFCKSVKVSKNGRIMQIIYTKEKEIGEIIPVAMCFNRMRNQLEVDLSEKENEEKIYSVQELMAIVWMDYTPSENRRVVLKDGKPLHLSLDNIGFEDVEE